MHNKTLALLWSLTQIILTAGVILVMKFAFNTGVDPLNFSYQILIVAALILFAYGLYKEPKQIFHLPIETISMVALIGVIGGGLVYALNGLGLKYSSATNFSFLIQTNVFFTAMLAFFFLKENLKITKIVLLVMLIAGIYLITTKGNFIIPSRGDILLLLGSLAYAIANIMAKVTLRSVPAITFTAYRILFGGLSLILFLILIGRFSVEINWLWTMGVGVMIAVGTLAIHKVLGYATASYMSMMSTITPVLTTIAAWTFLGETMSTTQLIGGGFIILAGIFINQKNI